VVSVDGIIIMLYNPIILLWWGTTCEVEGWRRYLYFITSTSTETNFDILNFQIWVLQRDPNVSRTGSSKLLSSGWTVYRTRPILRVHRILSAWRLKTIPSETRSGRIRFQESWHNENVEVCITASNFFWFTLSNRSVEVLLYQTETWKFSLTAYWLLAWPIL